MLESESRCTPSTSSTSLDKLSSLLQKTKDLTSVNSKVRQILGILVDLDFEHEIGSNDDKDGIGWLLVISDY